MTLYIYIYSSLLKSHEKKKHDFTRLPPEADVHHTTTSVMSLKSNDAAERSRTPSTSRSRLRRFLSSPKRPTLLSPQLRLRNTSWNPSQFILTTTTTTTTAIHDSHGANVTKIDADHHHPYATAVSALSTTTNTSDIVRPDTCPARIARFEDLTIDVEPQENDRNAIVSSSSSQNRHDKSHSSSSSKSDPATSSMLGSRIKCQQYYSRIDISSLIWTLGSLIVSL